MFLDVEKYQYYMLDHNGKRVYANRNVSPNPTQTRIETNEILTTSEKLRRLAEDLPF